MPDPWSRAAAAGEGGGEGDVEAGGLLPRPTGKVHRRYIRRTMTTRRMPLWCRSGMGGALWPRDLPRSLPSLAFHLYGTQVGVAGGQHNTTRLAGGPAHATHSLVGSAAAAHQEPPRLPRHAAQPTSHRPTSGISSAVLVVSFRKRGVQGVCEGRGGTDSLHPPPGVSQAAHRA
jgi:hypothetical protein